MIQQEPIRPARAARPHDAPAPRERGNERGNEVWPLPGICWNARVTTSFGELPVQGLRVRDLVKTSTGQFLPVNWVDQLHLDADFLSGCPDARAITIEPNSFGPGRPSQPLTVSPQQRLNAAMGHGTYIRPARDLLGMPGACRSTDTQQSYYLFHVGEPALVYVEGVLISTTP